MKVLIAPDKFKGSLSAREVCTAIGEALLQKSNKISIVAVPLADGGEGTLELLSSIFNCTILTASVNDPLFRPVKADYAISQEGTIAFIEMARASGLQWVEPEKRNPLYTSTFGTGELISDALSKGVRKIILGVGGSATNDAGIGMAAALGFQLLDASGNTLKPVGKNLIDLHSINSGYVHPRLSEVDFVILCDVDNPLYGHEGAAFIYAPQKGADREGVQRLDAGLRHFEKIAKKCFTMDSNFAGAGAGAAGGLGAGAKIFLNATLSKGIDYVMEATRLKEKMKDSDIVITGEGKIDKQSLSGKVVMEVTRLAKTMGKPVIALCGICDLTQEEWKALEIHQVISLVDKVTTPEEATRFAYELIKKRIIEEFSLL